MLAIAALCLLALSGVFAADTCYNDVAQECPSTGSVLKKLTLTKCNAMYGGFEPHSKVANELKAYSSLHLERSYQYLLSSAYFNNYQTNRAGFSKLFKKLSDDSWEKTIDLIKHVTMRGGDMDFSQHSSQKPKRNNYTIEQSEIQAVAMALDSQKELAERAFYIHHEVTRNSEHHHDPEIAQYMEEEYIEDHAKTIRNLAGHSSDLKKFVSDNNGQDLSLALYLFDEYLQKTI